MDLKWIVAALAVLVGAVVIWSVRPMLDVGDTIIFAQGNANQIALTNPSTGKIERIDAGEVIHGADTLPDGSKAYATSLNSDEISVIDLQQRREIAKVNIGGTSHHVEVSPDGRWGYFTLGSQNAVAVVDTNTDTLTMTIPVGEGPTYTVFTPDGQKAYVTSRKANVVSVIDTDRMSVIEEIAVDSPDHLALSPDGLRLFVASQGSNQISVIDTGNDEEIAIIPVGEGPHGVAAVESQGKLLVFVGNRGETTISVIDAAINQVIDVIDLKVSPEHLTPSSDQKYIFIGSMPDKSLFVFDVERSRIAKRMDVKGEIHQISVIDDAAAK